MKKIISLFLSILMVVTMFPLSVFAEEIVEPEEKEVLIEEPEETPVEVIDQIEIEGNTLDATIVESGYCGGEGDGTNLQWKLDGNGVLTISGTGKMADYFDEWSEDAQDYILNRPWEAYKDQIKKLVLEEGISYIGSYSFCQLYNVECEIVIPETVKVIGRLAFWDSHFSGELVLPEGLEKLEICSLINNGFTYVYIPSTLTEMENRAFWNHWYLEKFEVSEDNPVFCDVDGVIFTKDKKELVYFPGGKTGEYSIPEGTEIIRENAFSAFSGELHIPASVELIKPEAFRFYDFDITIDENNKVYGIMNDSLYSKAAMELIGYFGNGGETYVVPEGIKTICESAFYYKEIGQLFLPESIERIKQSAFANFTGDVFIKGRIETVEQWAFSNKYNNINIFFMSGSPMNIGENAFGSSENIKLYYLHGTEHLWKFDENGFWNGYEVKPFTAYEEVEIDESLYIASGYCGAYIFVDGKNLAWGLDKDGVLTIFGTGSMADYKREYDNVNRENNTTAPWQKYESNIKTLVLENGVTYIGANAFYGFKNFEGTLIIPETVSEIGDFGFYGCGFDKNLIIPGNVKVIGESAFSDWRITHTYGKITVSEGVEVIKSGAFSFSYFDSGELPSTVHTLGSGIFSFDMFLEDVVMSKDNPYYCIEDKIIYTKDKTKLLECLMTKKGEFVVPETVVEICNEAFWNTGLSTVTVSENVKIIGEGAFERCYYDIYILGQLESIGCRAFNIYSRSSNVYFFGGAPKKVESGNDWYLNSFSDEYINIYYIEGAEGWELDENGLWNGLRVISFIPGEEVVFNPEDYIVSGYCGDDFSVRGKNLAWGIDENGVLKIFGKGAMKSYSQPAITRGGGEIFDPEKVVAPWFEYTSIIETLVIEDGVTTIGDCAFMRSRFIGNLTMPDSLTSIGDYAFYGCGINDYYFAGDALEIGQYAFDADSDIIYYPAENATWEIIDGKWNGYNAAEWSDAALTISSATTAEGRTKKITVDLSENSKAAMIQFTIKYDPAVLEVVSCNAGELAKNATINYANAGKIGFVWENLTAVNGAGTVLEIEFKVKDEVPPQKTVVEIDKEKTFIFKRADKTDIIMDITAGTIEIIEVTYGDIDGDGEVNVIDAYCARLIAAKLVDCTEKEFLAGDVDGDGEITAIDANYIRKFAVEIIGSFPVENMI